MKKILFIITHPPYHTFVSQEFLDTILFAASFGMAVSVLFKDSGLMHLDPAINAPIKYKNVLQQIKGFKHFDIKKLYLYVPGKKPLNHSDLELTELQDLTGFFRQFDFVIFDEKP